jgi:hypothetical protein
VRSVDLDGPAGRLEALLNEGVSDAPFAALVSHPHPLGGGTLHNKVVYHAMKVLNAPDWGFGFPVLRYNFRGTGLSQGVHDGEAEAGDVRAALNWLEDEYRLPIVAVGFSFGAAMTLAACTPPAIAPASVRAIVCIGLPLEAEGRAYAYPGLGACTLPKLFLSGDRDRFAPASQLAEVTASAANPKQLALIPDADHFFTGRIEPMQQALAGWILEHLHDPGR